MTSYDPARRRAVAALIVGLALTACVSDGPLAHPVEGSSGAPAPAASSDQRSERALPWQRKAPEAIPPARTGRRAASARVRFLPEEIVLPGHAQAAVVQTGTVDGVLEVPSDVDRLGWWDGSAFAGDPFGSTVIAGHVDSATEGLGFFARLLDVREGQRVTVRGGGHRATYRITSVRLMDKKALAADSSAFDQRGAHRLVLITCAGEFRPERGGYDSNLVVTARPIGPAR